MDLSGLTDGAISTNSLQIHQTGVEKRTLLDALKPGAFCPSSELFSILNIYSYELPTNALQRNQAGYHPSPTNINISGVL